MVTVVFPLPELGAASIYVVYPHRRHLSAKIRAFVDFMADWFQKNGDACGGGPARPTAEISEPG